MPRSRPKRKKGAKKGEHFKEKGPEAFLEAFPSHGSIQATCEAIEIGRRTVYEWIAKDEKFRQGLEDARVSCDQKVVTSMFRLATTPVNPQYGARNAQVNAARVYGEFRGMYGDRNRAQNATPEELAQRVRTALQAIEENSGIAKSPDT